MQPRLDGPDRDAERGGHVREWQPDVVVQDDDRAFPLAEAPEHPVDELAIAEIDGCVSHHRVMDRRELDLDRTSASTADEIQARVCDESMQPGVEPVGIAKSRQVPPGADESVLDRVACELGVPEDEASHLVQPHDRRAGEVREGVMIALRCSLDEMSLVHMALGGARPTDRAS